MFQRKNSCSDAEMDHILADLRSGALDLPERQQDRLRLSQHSRACTSCRTALIEYAHSTETIPLLGDLAFKFRMRIDKLAERVVAAAQSAILDGHSSRVFALFEQPDAETFNTRETPATVENTQTVGADAAVGDDDAEPLGVVRRA